ncbi:MAG: hypothetical protein ACTHMR_04855 [Thermomicrobiales bacterium]
MAELRTDLRTHPLAALLLVACWGALTWYVAAGPGPAGVAVLLLPPCVASFLIGRSRLRREAPSTGLVAALIVGLLLLDLSLGALGLAGRGGRPAPAAPLWAALAELMYWAGVADLLGLLAGLLGWGIAWLREPTSRAGGAGTANEQAREGGAP